MSRECRLLIVAYMSYYKIGYKTKCVPRIICWHNSCAITSFMTLIYKLWIFMYLLPKKKYVYIQTCLIGQS